MKEIYLVLTNLCDYAIRAYLDEMELWCRCFWRTGTAFWCVPVHFEHWL